MNARLQKEQDPDEAKREEMLMVYVEGFVNTK